MILNVRTVIRHMQAVQYTGANEDEISVLLGGPDRVRVEKAWLTGPGRGMTKGLNLHTASGPVQKVREGWWVLRDLDTDKTLVVNDATFLHDYENEGNPNS